MKTCIKGFLSFIVTAILLSGCATVKNSAYLTDMAYDTSYQAPPAPELILREGDCVGIHVLSQTPELAAPFNQPVGDGAYTAGEYTVSRDGTIEFPVLGSIQVAGKTLKEAEQLIAGKISEKGWIKEPVVKASLDNFTVTVIGQSGNQVLPVKGSSINLFQAIAGTGGIKNNSNIRDIMVIRTIDGERTAYSVNLQSKDLFESPAFSLQQNDVVYIKQRGVSLSASGQSALAFVSAGLSLVTIISNFLLWAKYRQ